jgi:hypothetical protein
MITCNLIGGLGNQLFIIFATISFAIKNKQPFYFIQTNYVTHRKTYWSTFLSGLKIFCIPKLPKMYKNIQESGFHWNPLPEIQDQNECNVLHGYFQSYKYFEDNYNSICKLIKLDDYRLKIKNKHLYDYDNSISIHFRLGDYKVKQDFHPILSIEYYKNAIRYIQTCQPNEFLHILYFCEKEDNEDVEFRITELKQVFPNCTFFKIDVRIDDWEQMIMMSLCKNNIIANSTFSWWGAYINVNKNKIICYPELWFGPKLKHCTYDLFPESWIKIYR